MVVDLRLVGAGSLRDPTGRGTAEPMGCELYSGGVEQVGDDRVGGPTGPGGRTGCRGRARLISIDNTAVSTDNREGGCSDCSTSPGGPPSRWTAPGTTWPASRATTPWPTPWQRGPERRAPRPHGALRRRHGGRTGGRHRPRPAGAATPAGVRHRAQLRRPRRRDRHGGAAGAADLHQVPQLDRRARRPTSPSRASSSTGRSRSSPSSDGPAATSRWRRRGTSWPG